MNSLIRFAVEHRVTVFMVTVAAALFGAVSLGRLPVQLLPDISYPTLTIQTELADAAPSEIENLITRPLEEGVGVVPGLRRMSSLSQAGLSEITLEFGWDTEMDFAALDVREKMDLVRLPQDAGTPLVLRFDPALDPVIRLGLSGDTNPVHLRHLGEQLIKKELEALQGVAAAKVRGGLTEEIHVDIDENRLSQLGIPMSQIAQQLGAENVNAAGGRLRDRDAQFLVRTLNEFEGPEDVAQMIVHRGEGRVVRLADIAEVTRAAKERDIVSRIDSKTAVEIAIYKEGDANIVEVAERIRAQRANLATQLPEGLSLDLLSDQSVFIQHAVDQVRGNAMLGGVLAVLVLLVFLRDWRSTLIIAVSIPVSIVATFVLMFRQGVTLNVMSLGGLALGVGMLVDNSIVVLESIVRHKRMPGNELKQAVIDGTSEVSQAVTASTLTTIAVFLPILFVEGVARQIFKDQALTVAYALVVSLIVALTLTPMLAALGGGKSKQAVVGQPERGPGRAQRFYAGLLGASLRVRPLVVLLAVGLFGLSLAGAGLLGADLIPSMSRGEFRFDVELPEGTPIESTDVVSARLEEALQQIPGVATVAANVGVDGRSSGSSRAKRENHAEISLRLEDGVRGAAEEQVIDRARELLDSEDRLNATLLRPNSFSFRAPVSVELYGYELEELRDVSERLVARMASIDGLSDVRSTLEAGSPEMQIRFDRDKLQAAGLSLRDASQSLRSKILGDVATDYKERDRQIDVLVRSRQAQTARFEELRSMVVGRHEELPVHLEAVADLQLERGPAQIQRISQSRAVTINANLIGRDLAGVSAEIENEIARMELPLDVTAQIGGQNDEMKQSLGSLRFAVALAIFLVYLVMASQFESLLNPLLILFTVPLAFIGVFAGLWITQMSVSVVVMIGGIMLAGIVVNNGIVLVDLIGQLRKGGMAVREAIVTAGSTRLRPILMTTITTVLGLTPMAMGRGEGAEIGAPLAITVIGGLLVSTLLTLVVIPVLYSYAHREA